MTIHVQKSQCEKTHKILKKQQIKTRGLTIANNVQFVCVN